MLPARIYESAPLACRHCGAEMRIIAFVTDGVSVRRILEHIASPPIPRELHLRVDFRPGTGKQSSSRYSIRLPSPSLTSSSIRR